MTRETEASSEPVLRLVPMPGDINSNGHIFGGWILSQMDIAGGIVARRRAKGPVATVAIDGMSFIEPILLLDLISVFAHIERVGRTSMAVKVEVKAVREGLTEEIPVTEGLFTFVAIDERARPRPIDPE